MACYTLTGYSAAPLSLRSTSRSRRVRLKPGLVVGFISVAGVGAFLLASVPAQANPADSVGQPCNDIDRISFRDPYPPLVCTGSYRWSELQRVQVAGVQTIGKPCNLPFGGTAIGADPVSGAPYLVNCSQGAWIRYLP